jgi:hypothetical protein
LVADDRNLLVLDANERAITGRLGMYLQGTFPEWNVIANTTGFSRS